MSDSAKSRMVYPSDTDSPGWSWTKGSKTVVVVVVICFFLIILTIITISWGTVANIPSGNLEFDSGYEAMCITGSLYSLLHCDKQVINCGGVAPYVLAVPLDRELAITWQTLFSSHAVILSKDVIDHN